MPKLSLKILFLLLILSSALLTGCNKETVFPDSQQNEYIQLKVGNTWELEYSTFKITGTKIIDNKQYFILRDSIAANRMDYYLLRFADANSLYVRDYLFYWDNKYDYRENIEYLRFDFSKHPGEKWHTKTYTDTIGIWGGESLIMERDAYSYLYLIDIRVNDTLALQACKVFGQVNESTSFIEFAFAKNIGIVQHSVNDNYSQLLKRTVIDGKETIYNH